MNHAALAPFRAAADATRLAWRNPANLWSHTALGRQIAAGAELFERVTRRYAKPEFGIETVEIEGTTFAVRERDVWERPFCRLRAFDRLAPVDAAGPARDDPKLLIVAPMSGHYATLLRGTVEAMLPHAQVHITDWIDARMVPLSEGTFDLDDYIDYVVEMLEHLGPDTHVMAVCQPAVPVLAAVARMEAEEHPDVPTSMTLMGGPIDTRVNPTAVNRLAEEKSIDWFARRVIMQVPWPHPGFLRPVYPGFLQLGGFMSMNLDRHVTAHRDFFEHLVENDGDSAEKHREFYDEYLAVMDLTAEFYLQTVETVFIDHALPRGTMTHRGAPVDPAAIRRTALLTIEGENDDISGVGQTEAAHALCLNIPKERAEHLLQEKVGHYGIFNGSRFRAHIVPRVVDFMRRNARALDADEASKAPAATAVPIGEVIRLDGKRATDARKRRTATAKAEPDASERTIGDEEGAKAPVEAPKRRRRAAAKPSAKQASAAPATAKDSDGAGREAKPAKAPKRRASGTSAKTTMPDAKPAGPSDATAKDAAPEARTAAAAEAPKPAATTGGETRPAGATPTVGRPTGKAALSRKSALSSSTTRPVALPIAKPAGGKG